MMRGFSGKKRKRGSRRRREGRREVKMKMKKKDETTSFASFTAMESIVLMAAFCRICGIASTP